MKIKTILPWILLLAYYLDFKFQILVPILLLTGLALFLMNKFDLLQTISIKRNLQLVKYALISFPIYVLIVQLARIKVGTQGVDFAIFSQVVFNFSEGLGLTTSLIDYGWQHFLTHHFSPYLYLFGFINKFVHSPAIILIIFHVIAVSASLILAYQIIRSKHSFLISYLALTLIILLPAVRISLLWEVRDEIYALPFLLGAYLAYTKDKAALSITLLALSCLFKETLFLVSAGFALSVIAKNYFLPVRDQREVRPWIIFGCCAFLGFLLYSVILPYRLFWPTFNVSARLASISDFLSLELAFLKFKWLVVTFVPLVPIVFYLFYKKEIRAQILNLAVEALPIAPLILAILVTNFQPMLNPFNYYSVLPVFYLTVILFNNLSSGQHRKLSRMLTIAILLACFAGHQTDGTQDLRLALSNSSPFTQIAKVIPPSASVITDEYETNFFTQNQKVTRIFHANQNHLKFDYLVRRKDAPTSANLVELNKYYRSWSEVCFENETWVVRCAYPSQKALAG